MKASRGPWHVSRDCGDWNGDGANRAERCVYDVQGRKLATFYASPVVAAGSDAARATAEAIAEAEANALACVQAVNAVQP